MGGAAYESTLTVVTDPSRTGSPFPLSRAPLCHAPRPTYATFLPMSTISPRIVEDMKTAMKAKDTVALNVVRG